jgi:hypothetical protein
MAVNYSTTLKGNRMQAVLDEIDSHASPAILQILQSPSTVLAVITLSDPSFTRSGSVLTMAGTPRSDTSADASGTANLAKILKGDGTSVVVDGLTVGTAASDIILNSTTITAGQTITITSGTITHA